MMKVIEYKEINGTYRIFDSNSAVKDAGFDHVGLLTPEKMSEFERMLKTALEFPFTPPTLNKVRDVFERFDEIQEAIKIPDPNAQYWALV